jgi:murein DD-endopeptidase MepM/ murein hydrolase activator NlpD
MDPQRLARLLDSRSALAADGHPAGGLAGRPSWEPRTTVGSRGVLISGTPATPLAPELVGLDLPVIEQSSVRRHPAAAPAAAPGPAADESGEDEGSAAEQVVAQLADGRWWNRRRPSVVISAALLGVVSLGGLLTSGALTAHAAAPVTAEATSVAEELGLLRAQASALTEGEAADRLQVMVASRASREDAEAAAARVQAAADQAALDAAAEAARPQVVLPVAGARLTSGFGARWGTMHAGIDLAAPMRTPEYAAMDGVVLKAGAASGYGLAVYIQHGNGDVTVYGHMDSILVSEGQHVRAGDTIALLGNRGQSTGPHLHFEVHVGGMDGTKIDPIGWLREHGVAV